MVATVGAGCRSATGLLRCQSLSRSSRRTVRAHALSASVAVASGMTKSAVTIVPSVSMIWKFVATTRRRRASRPGSSVVVTSPIRTGFPFWRSIQTFVPANLSMFARRGHSEVRFNLTLVRSKIACKYSHAHVGPCTPQRVLKGGVFAPGGETLTTDSRGLINAHTEY